jgi:ribonuclease VapC
MTALLLREPGAAVVLSAFSDDATVLISAVSVTEVVGKLLDQGNSDADVDETVRMWGARTVPFTHELAMAAGKLRSVTRPFGLSLADRACLALAAAERAPVLTSDRQWAQLDIGVEVRLIR